MVAYTKPQQRKKEDSEQLRGERCIDHKFERWQVVTQESKKKARRSINYMPLG